MKKYLVVLVAVLLASFSFSFMWFDSPEVAAKKIDLQSFVESKFEYLQKVGKDAAFVEFQKPDGLGVDGEKYIFIFDLNGLCLVHSANPKLVGKNLIDLRDSKKKLFIQEFNKVIKADGKGWVEYNWTHPISKLIKPKLVYLIKIDDTSYMGCGIYKAD
ncbi:MAG: hypothetical protein A2Y40_10915 [Candidatus Margulisbacteria bacterium GWF2_35_9]|nr:MAG: hypothetical protein A2Y40_10915 [Candidatus Margulisbacteria bacterium GWF2_35_9]